MNIFQKLKGSEFVKQSQSDKTKQFKARVTVVKERLYIETLKKIIANSNDMFLYSQCKNLNNVLYLNDPVSYSVKFFTRALNGIFLEF